MPEVGPSPDEVTQPAVTPQFSCTTHSGGHGAAWVTAQGELDIASAPMFTETLRRALERVLLLVVDLRALSFIDSTGLQTILAADAQARRSGRRVVVIRGSGQVARLFDLVGLTERLAVVDITSVRLVPDPRGGAPLNTRSAPEEPQTGNNAHSALGRRTSESRHADSVD